MRQFEVLYDSNKGTYSVIAFDHDDGYDTDWFVYLPVVDSREKARVIAYALNHPSPSAH